MSEDNKKSLEVRILTKIAENTEKTAEQVLELSKKFELHVQKTEFELKSITKTNEIQNKILEEHHARSDRLEEQNKLLTGQLRAEIFAEGVVDPKRRETTLVGRIEKLEIPRKVIKWSIAAVVTILGLIATVAKILGGI